MSDYSPYNIPEEESVEETRRKKMEEFRMSYDQNALRGEPDIPAQAPQEPVYDSGYSYSDATSATSYSRDDAPLKRRRKNNEINSFSDYDTKKRIERDSKKELKRQKKEEKRIEKSKAKRNRRIFKLVWITMVVIVAVVISQYVMVGVNDLLAISRSENPHSVTVSIPADPTLDQIADILHDNGIILRPKFFKMYVNLTSSASDFRQGEFKIDSNKDYEAIVNTLQSNSKRTDIVTVQITEGMNLLEIANLLKENKVTSDINAFLDVCRSDVFDEDYPFLKDLSKSDQRYYKLEGYLFPDTYDFYIGEDPAVTVEKMLANYEKKVINHKERYFGNSKKSTLEQEAAKTGYTTDEILTIASIIQAEAANKEDMYNISSILHNRLKYGAEYGVAQLNCDCTVYYPYRNKEAVPESDRAIFKSRYDTNSFTGLPPGPICNPGIEAIKAAINPYETDYIFFCHDTAENGGTPYYSSSLEEHEYYLSIIGSN